MMHSQTAKLNGAGLGPSGAFKGQTPSKELEGAVELGLIRPDLLTTHQIQMLAQSVKGILFSNNPSVLPRFTASGRAGNGKWHQLQGVGCPDPALNV